MGGGNPKERRGRDFQKRQKSEGFVAGLAKSQSNSLLLYITP
jgi:hypothetical protein